MILDDIRRDIAAWLETEPAGKAVVLIGSRSWHAYEAARMHEAEEKGTAVGDLRRFDGLEVEATNQCEGVMLEVRP